MNSIISTIVTAIIIKTFEFKRIDKKILLSNRKTDLGRQLSKKKT